MEKAEEMVTLRTERYEKLVAAEAKLEIVEASYKTMERYYFDVLLQAIFGEKEETGKC